MGRKTALQKYLSEIGRLGGNKIKERGPDYYRAIQQKGLAVRRAKMRCKSIDKDRRCPKNGLKYKAGGVCPCFQQNGIQ